ncbi:hypothetical protein ACIP6P_26825 [Streptomyces sp. NPDC088729]|uniref:hypothetical protein n=1 Tax=Streptomyces sp. NPDC088729 TaxID=3365876 RepID=UPI0038137B99
MSDLVYGIGQALADGAEDYDIDAIAESLRQQGAQSVDDVAADEFWALVEKHALPDSTEVSALDRFMDELAEAVKTPAGTPALWKRGGVTLEITGFSRVNMVMPQPLATFRLAVAGGVPVRLTAEETSSWPCLWETVESHLDAWTVEVRERRDAYERALSAKTAASLALIRATAAADHARQALAEVAPETEDGERGETMSKNEVAQYLGIAPGSVRKQMSRWGIEATGERGKKRLEARYPTAEVQARAARRPGRGHRSDLA